MRVIALFLVGTFMLIAQKNPIIKVEGEDLLKELAYTKDAPFVKLYDWELGGGTALVIHWDPNGNNWTPKGFERKGKVYLSNHGKITHTIVEDEVKPGYWTLELLGNKDKIIQATLTPSNTTMENPSIAIDKSYIKEKVICQEDSKQKHTAYLIKFPQKLPFWMEEKTTFSTKGNESRYLITYDKKPACVIQSHKQTKRPLNTIDTNTKEQIKLFLTSFYKSGEEDFPAKTLHFYDSKVDRYFSMENVTKEEILEDKIHYYNKWPIRKYSLKAFEVIDTSVVEGVRRFVVSTAVEWSVATAKKKQKRGTSYNLITLIETQSGFLVKSIKSIGDHSAQSNSQKKQEHASQKANLPKQKTITFKENGIRIHLIYPDAVKGGEYFQIRAKMTNYHANAKQGGLTLSFPDMISMRGRALSHNFTSLQGYTTPDKIYNKHLKRAMRAKYFMIEGWQSKTWRYAQSKYFTVELRAPSDIDRLSVNVRGVLWIRHKHDLREVPTKSNIYDQQGFPVKRFTIQIK